MDGPGDRLGGAQGADATGADRATVTGRVGRRQTGWRVPDDVDV